MAGGRVINEMYFGDRELLPLLPSTAVLEPLTYTFLVVLGVREWLGSDVTVFCVHRGIHFYDRLLPTGQPHMNVVVANPSYIGITLTLFLPSYLILSLLVYTQSKN